MWFLRYSLTIPAHVMFQWSLPCALFLLGITLTEEVLSTPSVNGSAVKYTLFNHTSSLSYTSPNPFPSLRVSRSFNEPKTSPLQDFHSTLSVLSVTSSTSNSIDSSPSTEGPRDTFFTTQSNTSSNRSSPDTLSLPVQLLRTTNAFNEAWAPWTISTDGFTPVPATGSGQYSTQHYWPYLLSL
jgi:hypothetical protein